jgi:uncharacterized repeat protein (TIGR01451 family)
MARAGDTVVYTLSAKNTGKAKVSNYSFTENISDILDYADVVDLHGGVVDSEQVVTWPGLAINPGATATKQITVKVKDPIPDTPVAPSDPGHFDLLMTNVFGNTINIKLPPPPAKAVETVTATLPNTGPGTSILIAATIMIIGGYFYGRARLLAKETSLALHDNASGGI